MPVPQGSGVIHRKSARQAVYETVCDWIITGVLEPGEKILDSELGEYFSVSRTPVREALQLLQSQKLVLVMPGRATVVAPLDTQDIEKCYRPLADLEALAAELACGKLTENDFLSLSAAARCKGGEPPDDAAAVMACDERFHERMTGGGKRIRDGIFRNPDAPHPQNQVSLFPSASYARRPLRRSTRVVVEALRAESGAGQRPDARALARARCGGA